MDTLQKRLKKARKLKGLSQGAVAELAKIAQPTYSDLENGVSQSSTRLADLARALGVNLVWLSLGEGEMYGPDASSEKGMLAPSSAATKNTPTIDLTADENTLIKAYRRLLESNEEQANLVMQVAFGAKPTQSTVNYPTTKELLDGWKDMLAEALSTDYQDYAKAANDSDKKIIEAKIGGRVIKMIEERERQLGAPGKVDRRTK